MLHAQTVTDTTRVTPLRVEGGAQRMLHAQTVTDTTRVTPLRVGGGAQRQTPSTGLRHHVPESDAGHVAQRM